MIRACFKMNGSLRASHFSDVLEARMFPFQIMVITYTINLHTYPKYLWMHWIIRNRCLKLSIKLMQPSPTRESHFCRTSLGPFHPAELYNIPRELNLTTNTLVISYWTLVSHPFVIFYWPLDSHPVLYFILVSYWPLDSHPVLFST